MTQTRVVNAYHYGGLDKLPKDMVYIGRPSAFGNRYSSISGIYSREDCVALHRVDVYNRLCSDPTYLDSLKAALYNRTLACFCKHKTHLEACHGDNYVHILSDAYIHRTYDGTVLSYLMEDLRSALSVAKHKADTTKGTDDFFTPRDYLDEVILAIEAVFLKIKTGTYASDTVLGIIARLAVETELAVQEPDAAGFLYRLHRVRWQADRFVSNISTRAGEPVSPYRIVKPKK